MKKFYKIILILLLSLTFLVWSKVAKSPTASNVSVYFLDVGQGDAALIQKGNYQILIDGGPDDKVLTGLGKVMPLTDRKIEVMILSHPHADHLVGLNQILDRYEIGQIYMTGVLYTSNQYLEFLSKIKEKNITANTSLVGDEFKPFDGSTFTFLWPGDQYREKEIDNLNNSSIVSKFCYLQKCVLLTGDIETDAQSEMFAYYSKNIEIFKSDILKIPHHGSINGINESLLNIVAPKEAIIEVGADNKFGHPHKQTIDLLEKSNIRIHRTDRDGTIKFNFD